MNVHSNLEPCRMTIRFLKKDYWGPAHLLNSPMYAPVVIRWESNTVPTIFQSKYTPAKRLMAINRFETRA